MPEQNNLLQNVQLQLTAKQINEVNGLGYRLNFEVKVLNHDPRVSCYMVYLCGVNPLTGRDLAEHGIGKSFSFTGGSFTSDRLTYHGSFTLHCTAQCKDGTTVTIKEQPLELKWQKSEPWIKWTPGPTKQGFTCIMLESNCWNSCRGKIWFWFDGHMQQVALPQECDRTVRLYIPTTGNVELRVHDKQIRIINGKKGTGGHPWIFSVRNAKNDIM